MKALKFTAQVIGGSLFIAGLLFTVALLDSVVNSGI